VHYKCIKFFIIVVGRLHYYRARLRRHFGHVPVVTPTMGIATTRDVIVVSFLRVDDVSATPDLGEGHPTDLTRLPPPPPPGSYFNLLGSPAAVSVRLRSFLDRPAPQLNAILPPALPTCAHVRNLTRSNALITFFCT